MSSALLSPRFFNPLVLWTDVALKTGEMLVSSGSVIQIRTQRLATAGLAPSADDLAEFQLMGQEKLVAANESGAAIADELHNTQFTLVNRAVRHWFGTLSAFFALTVSTTPAQAIERHSEFVEAATRSAATVSQLSSASARIAQRGLKPIHAKATSNARRLAPMQFPAPAAAA